MGKTSKKMKKILDEFLELGMLIKDGETFLIKNWYKYQSIDKYEKYQIQNRERQKRYRDKTNSEKENSNVTITLDNAKEKNRIDNNTEEIIKEDTKREEEENGFREYKL